MSNNSATAATQTVEQLDTQIVQQKVTIDQAEKALKQLQDQVQQQQQTVKEEKRKLYALQHDRATLVALQQKSVEIVQYASKVLYSTGSFARVSGVRC